MMPPCKDCADRFPACHDSCDRFATWRKEHSAEVDYTRKMLDPGKVFHYDCKDRHRDRCRKHYYFGHNGGADR